MATLTFNARSARQTLFVIGSLFAIYLFFDLFVILFVAYILMATIMPAVKKFERVGFPRWVAIVSVYALCFLAIGVMVGLTFGSFIIQMQLFIAAIPGFLVETIDELDIEGSVFQPYIYDALATFSEQLTRIPVDLIRFGTNVFGGVLNVIMVFIFTFYLTLRSEKVHSFLV